MRGRLTPWVVLCLLLGFSGGCATHGNPTDDQGISSHSDTIQLNKNTPTERQKKALAPSQELPDTEFNIPIVVNRDVEWFIRYFQTTNRKHFTRWLERSARYIPIMKQIFDANGLPTDLVYLAMIESGFNNAAYSHRHAVGPWQFIRGTAKRYNLNIDWWIDERRDPLKATVAAAQYLKDLYDMFNSWFLAAAGYNAGENKIKRAIRRHQTQDFWELKNGRYLKPETKQYIPKLIAATLIAKDPVKYGFYDLQYFDPLAFDTVTVDAPIDLRDIARITDSPYEEIKRLNPELRRWCTPPHITEYQLKIPPGKKEVFLTHYETIKPKDKMLFHSHQVRSGETLSHIARRYGTPVQPIMEMNNISSPKRLRPGQHLIIPVRAAKSPTDVSHET